MQLTAPLRHHNTATKNQTIYWPHLLIWIGVIVEADPTVICDFREVFVIKLLEADVVGWPGNTQEHKILNSGILIEVN